MDRLDRFLPRNFDRLVEPRPTPPLRKPFPVRRYHQLPLTQLPREFLLIGLDFMFHQLDGRPGRPFRWEVKWLTTPDRRLSFLFRLRFFNRLMDWLRLVVLWKRFLKPHYGRHFRRRLRTFFRLGRDRRKDLPRLMRVLHGWRFPRWLHNLLDLRFDLVNGLKL